MELQSLAQAGLFYGKDIFDRERYTRIREISAEQNLDLYEIISRANEFPDLKRSSAKLSEFYNLIQSLTDFCE